VIEILAADDAVMTEYRIIDVPSLR